MHKDTIVGVAGAAILVAAMAGVFWYEGTRGAETQGARSFSIAFAESDGNGPGLSGTATVGQADTKPLAVRGGNFTRLTFTLVWTDEANTAPDSFVLEVRPPNATGLPSQKSQPTANAANGQGEIALEFDLGEVPAGTSLFADTEEEAEQRAMANSATSRGAGEWTIIVTLTAAGDATPVPLPGGLPVNPADDNSNAWELRTLLTTFAASAS